jgi:hypothetical protein
MATIFIVPLLLTACSSASEPIESPVTEDEATEMAESALQAFNESDYTRLVAGLVGCDEVRHRRGRIPRFP